MAAPKPLWAPEALWTLPPNPYVNRTPKADAYEKAKWVVVGLTLFIPRLLLTILTSARVRAGWSGRGRRREGLQAWQAA
jgi:hypothetical protein